MNRTRIVIPTAPPRPASPHFDDEVTIISARPVVPIPPAKMIDSKRMLLVIMAPLLSAAVFGAAAAVGVNYYENRQRSPLSPVTRSPVNRQPTTNQAPASRAESPNSTGSAIEQRGGAAPVSRESASPQPERSTSQNEAPDENVGSPASRAGATAANFPGSGSPPPAINPRGPAATDARKGGTVYDPSRLVRRRRVHQAGGRNGKRKIRERQKARRWSYTGNIPGPESVEYALWHRHSESSTLIQAQKED